MQILEEGNYVGLMTSKVFPSAAFTNLLLMNNPVLVEVSSFKRWRITVVDRIFHLGV